MRTSLSFIALLAVVVSLSASAQATANPCPNAQPVPAALRLPATIPPGEPRAVEEKLLSYFNSLNYRKLGWCVDKSVRDTGPFMSDVPATVHPPVRIYYSPEVSKWLLDGRHGDIPDGAVIIKEQFSHPVTTGGPSAPAAYFANIALDQLPNPQDWSFMIKNSKASRDGWFWGEVYVGLDTTNKFQYPNSGYGLYCLRCHASAAEGLTFSSLKNIKGAPGWPIQYRVDNSWIAQTTAASLTAPTLARVSSPKDFIDLSSHPLHAQNAALLAKTPHPATPIIPLLGMQVMPPEPLDNTVAASTKTPVLPGHPASLGFVTSSQCLGCHSGLTSAGLGPTMVIPADPTHRGTASSSAPDGINISPYGEWRWSPMGLAGRDPVFFSQMDSELAYLKDRPSAQQGVIDTCMTCHGAMGKRSYTNDFPKNQYPTKDFKLEFVYETDPAQEGFKYGALARDGISCEVCHRMAAPSDRSIGYFLKNLTNGNFALTPPDSLNGPFEDNVITPYPMSTGLGIKPRHDAYINSSQMCGSCHTIILPVLDSKEPGQTSIEQATYLEWLNSQYRNEYGSVGAAPQTCQQCHMPSGYVNDRNHVNVASIQDRIAIVQDGTYPEAEHLATPADINVRYRTSGYARHEFLGTNGFLLQMFQQVTDTKGDNAVLGVRLGDYMTVSSNDLPNASANVVQQAQTKVAQVSVSPYKVEGNKLVFDVTVQNLVGHRYPSGVGFRRAFLEVQVSANGKSFFTSGGTDAYGKIVDNEGRVLRTESFANGQDQYQPHFSQSNPITDSSQVQIYEELMKDADGHFTTEFTRRDTPVKDNRLLPIGWTKGSIPGVDLPKFYRESTHPYGAALEDPVYLAGKGQSIVRYQVPLPAGVTAAGVNVKATLYTQNTPPYFLEDRYKTDKPATARLRFLAESLKTLENTDYAGWKLKIASAAR